MKMEYARVDKERVVAVETVYDRQIAADQISYVQVQEYVEQQYVETEW